MMHGKEINIIPDSADLGKAKSLDISYVAKMKEREQLNIKEENGLDIDADDAHNNSLVLDDPSQTYAAGDDGGNASDANSERKNAGGDLDAGSSVVDDAAGNGMAHSLGAAGKMSPRQKTLKSGKANSKAKVADHRASAKRIRTLFQETISTKVKKQEKFITENPPPQSRVQDVGLKSHRTNQLTSDVGVHAPSPNKPNNQNANFHNSSLNVNQASNINNKNIPKPFNRMSTLRKKGSKIDPKDDDDGFDSDEERNETQAEKLRRKQEWLNRFKLKPLDPEKDLNPDGTEKFKCRTKLMIKILAMKNKKENEHSEDNMVNSFDEDVSTVSEDEEDEEVDDEELKARKAKKKAKKKKAKKANMLKILQMNAMKAKQAELKKKKIRRPIMNVYCTDYDVVKKAAKQTCGFRLKEYQEDHDGGIIKGEHCQKLNEDWDVSWHNGGITADYFAKMQPYQKVNQYPGITCISRKNNLARNLVKTKKAFPDKFQFFPRTWILPMEASEFRNNFIDQYGRTIVRRKTFIVKPDNLAQGKGIFLSRNFDKIIEHTSNFGGGWVAQDYLSNPHLIEGLKYDLRLYVFLYGLNPLRIFIHEQGLARFATEPYEKPRASNIDNMYVHLTNYAINKMNTNFKQNNKQKKAGRDDDYGDYGDYGDEYDDEDEEETGHKRSLFAIMKIIYQQGGDPDKIWEEIKDIVVKTIIVGQPYMDHMYRVCQPECIDNSMCFQILGFDVMIDKNFRPWLIEVNQSPSFSTDSPLDYEVKKHVLKDALAMLDMSQERRENYIRIRNEQNQERMMTGKTHKMSPQEREKLKHDRIQARIDFERVKLNGSGYEQIFPQIYDDEKNAEYQSILKKAQEIWDDFTTGKQKRLRIHEELEQKKKQEALQINAQNQRMVKKKPSRIIAATVEPVLKHEDAKSHHSMSEEDEGAIKQTHSSIDQKQERWSQKSPRDQQNSNLKTQDRDDQRKSPPNKLVKIPAVNRNSFNVNMHAANQKMPFFDKSNGKIPDEKKGTESQIVAGISQPMGTNQKLSDNRHSIGIQKHSKIGIEGIGSAPYTTNTHPIQKSIKPSTIHMDLQAAYPFPPNNLAQQTPQLFTNRKKQPIVLNNRQGQQNIHGFNHQSSINYGKSGHTQISISQNQHDPFSSKDTTNDQDLQGRTSIDSRPSSNPQGSPSKHRYNYLGDIISRTDFMPNDSSTFTAQKQYLEDIVQRQEQKIKYYQRIIQQQRLIDDKILQNTAGISKLGLNDQTKHHSNSNNYRNEIMHGLVGQQVVGSSNSQVGSSSNANTNLLHQQLLQPLPNFTSSQQQQYQSNPNSRMVNEGRHNENLGSLAHAKRMAGLTPSGIVANPSSHFTSASQNYQHISNASGGKPSMNFGKAETEQKVKEQEKSLLQGTGLLSTVMNVTVGAHNQSYNKDDMHNKTQQSIVSHVSNRLVNTSSNQIENVARHPLKVSGSRPSQSLSMHLHQSIGTHLTKFEQEMLPQLLESGTDQICQINQPATHITRTNSIRQTTQNPNQNFNFSNSNQKQAAPQTQLGQNSQIKQNQNIFMPRMANVGLQHMQNSSTKSRVPTQATGISVPGSSSQSQNPDLKIHSGPATLTMPPFQLTGGGSQSLDGQSTSTQKQNSQSAQNISGLNSSTQQNYQQNSQTKANSNNSANHHKLIIDAIRGEGIERSIFQKSNNMMQGAIGNRMQNHQKDERTQDDRSGPYQSNPSQGANGQMSKPYKSVMQHVTQDGAQANMMSQTVQGVSREQAHLQYGKNASMDGVVKASNSILHNQLNPSQHPYKVDHSYQHLISSLALPESHSQTQHQAYPQNYNHIAPTSGQYAIIQGRQQLMGQHQHQQQQSSPKFFGSSAMQNLSLQGVKKERHNPHKRFDQYHTQQQIQDLNGRQIVDNPPLIIQPVQVEFSKVIDDQANFEKTKKDQFRDYKNLIVQDQAREESRFKHQKRSVFTQPGSNNPSTSLGQNEAAAAHGSSQRHQLTNKTVSINDVNDDNLFIQSSQFPIQEQLQKRLAGGDIENNRKSFDLQALGKATKGVNSHGPSGEVRHFQSPAIRIKKLEPQINEKGGSPPTRGVGLGNQAQPSQQNIQFGIGSSNQRMKMGPSNGGGVHTSISPLKAVGYPNNNTTGANRAQPNNRPQGIKPSGGPPNQDPSRLTTVVSQPENATIIAGANQLSAAASQNQPNSAA